MTRDSSCRPASHRRVTAAVTVAITLFAVPAGAAEPAALVRVALVSEGPAPEADAAAAALRAVLRGRSLGPREVELISRTATDAESSGRAALAEMALEGAEVVVAIGEGLARVAPTAVRDRPVVVVAPRPDASGGRVRSVGWAPDPALVAEEIRRIAPGARRIGVAGPSDGLADAIAAALAPRAGGLPAVDRLVWSEASRSFGADLSAAEVVVAAADVPPEQVTDLARRLHGQAVLLVGTRAAHLDAGAAIVLRTRPADVAGLAAAAAFDALRGRDGPEAAAHPRSVAREIHLPNARRLRFTVPLAVLASSERTVSAAKERR